MKSFLLKIICMLAVVLAAVGLCTVRVSAASFKLNRKSTELPINYAITIKATGNESDAVWSVKDGDIAEIVSSDGSSARIVGRKTGSTYVYAEADGVKLKCRVTVKMSFISADKDSLKLEKGETGKITFTVKGSKKIAVSRSDKSVCSLSWSKWDGDRITLSVKALKSGSTDIKVYAKGYSKSTAETVKVTVAEQDGKSGGIAGDITDLVNNARKDAGLSELENDPKLNKIADMRAKELAEKFSHTRPDGTDCFAALEENGISNVYGAENIAGGYASAEDVVDGWMQSSGHKANILGKNYTRIGVGMYESDGTYYWVQLFTSDY